MTENRYQIYDLRGNPFPQVAVASKMNPGPFVDFNPKIVQEIDRLIMSSVEKGAWGGIPVIGPVGSGKSRLLYEIFEKYKDKGELKLIIVDNPGISLKQFYGNLVEEILRDDEFVTILVSKYDDMMLKALKVGKNGVTSLLDERRRILSADNRGVAYDKLARSLMSEHVVDDPSLARAIAVLCVHSVISKKDLIGGDVLFVGKVKEAEEDYRIAKDFLKANHITKGEASRLGFECRELSDKTIVDYAIRALVNVYRMHDHKMLFLLVDQFERIIEQLPMRTMLGLLDAYRSLIDRNLEYLSGIFACTTESWYESTRAYGSFKDRFTEPIEIPKITLDIALRLVVAYCDLYRLSTQHKGSLFPFDRDSIQFILQRSPSTRDFLENCHTVLLNASLKQQPAINRRNVQDLF